MGDEFTKILRRITASSEKILTAGRDRVQALRRERHRQALLTELGRHCYDDRSGEGIGETNVEIDRLVTEISLIEGPEALEHDHLDIHPARVPNVLTQARGHGA